MFIRGELTDTSAKKKRTGGDWLFLARCTKQMACDTQCSSLCANESSHTSIYLSANGVMVWNYKRSLDMNNR